MKSFLILIFLSTTVLGAPPKSDISYTAKASLVSDAPTQIIWDTLTDYDNMEVFLTDVKESKFVAPDILKLKIKIRVWFVTKTIDLELKITETMCNKIEFESISSDQSFYITEGVWELTESGQANLSYNFVAKPSFFGSRDKIPGYLKKETDLYIKDLQKEINRRVLDIR